MAELYKCCGDFMMPGNILIVDDVVFDGQVLAWVVEQMGMTYVLCNNGQEAIALLKRNRAEIDAMLLDLHMPAVDGVSALGHCSAHYPNFPIFIVTSSAERENESICRKFGVAGYVRKPLDFS